MARKQSGLMAHLAPLSDPAANAKLLALGMAQMLSSIATLMHDTYLPLCERPRGGCASVWAGLGMPPCAVPHRVPE